MGALINAPAMLRPSVARVTQPKMAFIDTLEGTGEETGGEIWDPLDIAGSVGDEALMWFRASELKHGRVAMLATVGYLTGAAGITFPGEIAKGVSFESVNQAAFSARGPTCPRRASCRSSPSSSCWSSRRSRRSPTTCGVACQASLTSCHSTVSRASGP